MIDPDTKQALINEEQLRLLSLGFLISGCVSAFFSLFGLFYAFIGVTVASIGSAAVKAGTKAAEAPPVEIGWIFGTIGTVFFLGMLAMALAKFKAAANLKKRKGRTFCMIVAGVSCLGVPYGVLLGVSTFIVLGRASVAQLFEAADAHCVPAVPPAQRPANSLQGGGNEE